MVVVVPDVWERSFDGGSGFGVGISRVRASGVIPARIFGTGGGGSSDAVVDDWMMVPDSYCLLLVSPAEGVDGGKPLVDARWCTGIVGTGGGGVLLPARSTFPKNDCSLFLAGVTMCSAGRVDESVSSDGGFGGFRSRKMEREAILLIGLNAVLADLGESDMVAMW